MLFIKQINEARIHTHIYACNVCIFSVRESKLDDSPASSDDGRSIETVLYAVSINPLLPVPTPFSLLRCSPLSIRQVLLTRLVFTGKTDIYITLYWLARHPKSFQRPVERIVVKERESERDKDPFSEYSFLPRR